MIHLAFGAGKSSDAHGVFDAGRTGTLGVVDEAWGIAQRGGPGVTVVQQGNRTVYTVDMGRRVGYVGGQAGAASGKRFTFDTPIGTSPSGHPQNSIFVHWSPNHGIHGVPTTVGTTP